MPLNFTSDIMSLFNTKVGNDANYESPGNFNLSAAISGSVGVDHVNITTPGAYTVIPGATAGTGDATFQVRVKLLAGTTLATAGTVYTPGNVLTLSGGTKSTTAHITVSTCKLVSASILSGGTGYGATSTFTVTVAGASLSAATISVTTNGAGVVSLVNSVTAAGSYSTLPTLTANAVTGDNGTNHGSNLTMNLVFGINTFTVSTAGVYTAIPSNPISVTGGSGTGATFTGSWGVDSLVVTNAGAYETIAPVIIFDAGSAAATAVLGTTTLSTDTQKMLMLVELVRSLIAETNNTVQLKDLHEVLRQMMTVMKFGSKTTYSAATTATRALNSAMNYIAKNKTHGGASI